MYPSKQVIAPRATYKQPATLHGNFLEDIERGLVIWEPELFNQQDQIILSIYYSDPKECLPEVSARIRGVPNVELKDHTNATGTGGAWHAVFRALGGGVSLRLNKMTIILCSVFSLIALFFAYYSNMLKNPFWTNMAVGIFSSFLVTFMVSVINYLNERRKALEAFVTQTLKVVENFKRYEYDGDIDSTIDIILSINEFDFSAFNDAYGDITFLFSNRNQNYIYETFYEPVWEAKALLLRSSYHFKEYKRATNGNTAMMKHYIEQIDTFFISRSIECTKDDNDLIIPVTKNKIVDDLGRILCRGDRYYEIMYPYKTFRKKINEKLKIVINKFKNPINRVY